jgi:peptidoglycan/LPS O-acetylase OafA/YrhL
VERARYDMLDGWRGLAASAVVVQHIFAVQIGHSAVMLFFVISGYCITASATSCLRRGYGFREFMGRRIRRIYAPYLLAIAYFAVTRLVKLRLTGVNELDASPLVWLANLSLTQWLSLIPADLAYASDNPVNLVPAYWSLQYEEQFYLIVAGMMVASARFGRSLLWLGLPLIGLSLVWNLRFPYVSHGLFIEYWLHFGIGLLVFYRLCRVEGAWPRRMIESFLVLLAGAAGFFAWFAGIDWTGKRPLARELFIVAAFGLVLIAARSRDARFGASLAGRLLMKLGLISYSLYLVHQCNVGLIRGITDRIVPADWVFASGVVQLALHVLAAIPFYWLCERPFQNPRLEEIRPLEATA